MIYLSLLTGMYRRKICIYCDVQFSVSYNIQTPIINWFSAQQPLKITHTGTSTLWSGLVIYLRSEDPIWNPSWVPFSDSINKLETMLAISANVKCRIFSAITELFLWDRSGISLQTYKSKMHLCIFLGTTNPEDESHKPEADAICKG